MNYKEQILKLNQELGKLEEKSRKYSWFRLIAFVGGITASFLAYQFGESYVFITIAIVFFIFLFLVRLHTSISKNIKEKKLHLHLSENEINVRNGELNLYSDGQEFQSKVLNFGHDLDIYGPNSLFHFINRCATKWGQNILSSFFSEKSYQISNSSLKERQEAISELVDKADFSNKLSLNLFGNLGEKRSFRINVKGLKDFKFKKEILLKGYVFLVPFLWLAVIFSLFTSFEYTKECTLLIIFINFSIMGRVSKEVGSFIEDLDSTSNSLERFAEVIKLISLQHFKSKLIKTKVQFLDGEDFHAPLLRLSTAIEQLDIRKNMMGLVVLYTIIPFDIFVVIKIRKWFTKYPDLFEHLFDVIGHLEAYNSMAVLQRNHPSWSLPNFSEDESYILEGEEMGHPLIFEGKNGSIEGGVRNTYSLNRNNRISIVTGSNMSGKSTFLRVIGINLLMAYAGGVTCSSKFTVGKRVQLITSMRIADSLLLSESTFKAELERIRLIINAINNKGPYLFLVDEMLRGTNSVDKLKGSFALLDKLKQSKDANIIVATHDLQLSEFENTNTDFTKNYHFDFDYSNSQFDFDYKLKNGVCEKFNASLLLNELGLETN